MESLSSMELDPDRRQSTVLRRSQVSKACTNCARVKCKCIQRLDGTGCERCHRLSKPCESSAPAKQRGPKRGAASRSARLEEKLDDLVALLRAQQQDHGDSPSHGSANDGFEMDDGVHSLSTSPSLGEEYPDDPSPLEADQCLHRFREEMIIFTPYFHLPADMTSVQLRHMYPFFWLNVMGVSSESPKTRNALSLQSRRTIVERVVAGGERSLDLLLGILTFVNWVYLFPMDKQFACLASQLAVTIIWDLGLQMPPPDHLPRFAPAQSAIIQKSFGRERTVEEQRLVLGAFVITSMVSQTFKVADGLRWSTYLDEYLTHISNHGAVPHDKVLVRQVKMQLIVNQVRYSSTKMSTMEVPTVWVDILQSQLDELMGIVNGVAVGFAGSDSIMLGYYHYTTLIIREWIMAKPTLSRHEPDLRRYEVYQRCASTIKAWLDIFFSMPLRGYFNTPCSTYSQLCYVVVFLHQISTAKDATWNPTAAQEVVDLLQTVDRIICTFEQVRTADTMQNPGCEENQALSLIVSKFQTLKTLWNGELEAHSAGSSAIQSSAMLGTSPELYDIEPLDFYNFDILPNI